MKISRLTPTFGVNVLPPVDICLDEITSTLKMEAVRPSEMSILPYEFIRYQSRTKQLPPDLQSPWNSGNMQNFVFIVKRRGKVQLGPVFNLVYRNGNCLCLEADIRFMGEVFSEFGVVNWVAALKNGTVHYGEQDIADIRTEPGPFKVEIYGLSKLY